MPRIVSKHGGARTPLYKVWVCIKQRCLNPGYAGFSDYGARGITICPEWTRSFEAFRDWANSNGYERGLTIDRRDNNGGYSPENCRWIPQDVNKRNTRRNRVYEAFGESKCVSEWSRDPRCAVNLVTLNTRLSRGWTFLDAFTTLPAKDKGSDGRFVARSDERTTFTPYKPAK